MTKLMPLHNNLFIESNPAPIKYAMSLLGKMDENCAFRWCQVSEAHARRGAQRHGACRPDQLGPAVILRRTCRNPRC